MRLLRGEIRKLVKRPASFITLGIQLAIVALIYLAVAASFRAAEAGTNPGGAAERAGMRLLLSFPSAYAGALGLITGLGGLLAVAYGAAAAGADWGWGMVKVAVARGESRSRYILTKLVAVEVLLVVGLLVSYLGAVIAAAVAATVTGIGTAGIGDPTVLGRLPEDLARGYIGMAEQAAIGFAIATLARSQLAGLGAGIALYFVEQFSTIFIPDIVKYLPFHVAQSALRLSVGGGGGAGGGGASASIDQSLGVALVGVYFVAAAVVSAVMVERAEISG
jgi:hypothetical protein